MAVEEVEDQFAFSVIVCQAQRFFYSVKVEMDMERVEEELVDW